MHHKQESWINAAKGIGVLLVILGHNLYKTSFSPCINQIIYSFHVPMFFVLSGYLQHDFECVGIFVRKKAKRLLIPFFLYSVVSFFSYGIEKIKTGDWAVTDALVNSLFIKGKIANNPLWFLIVLFFIIIAVALFRIPRWNIWLIVIACTASFLCSWILYELRDYTRLNYFGFNKTVLCFAFFLLGMTFHKIKIFDRPMILSTALVPLMLLGLGLDVFCGVFLNTKVSVYAFALGTSYLSFVLAAIGGSFFVLSLCKLCLDRDCWICEISTYSVLFLGTQYYVIYELYWKYIRVFNIEDTRAYDYAMLIVMAEYVLLFPRLYELLKKKCPALGILNGE